MVASKRFYMELEIILKLLKTKSIGSNASLFSNNCLAYKEGILWNAILNVVTSVFCYNLFTICFKTLHFLFKRHLYSIDKKGGGSREPLSFPAGTLACRIRKSSFLPLFFNPQTEKSSPLVAAFSYVKVLPAVDVGRGNHITLDIYPVPTVWLL